MVRTHHSRPPVREPTREVTRRRKALIATVITLATVGVVLQTSQARYNPEPYHTSVLSGEAWVNEMLDGHHDRLMDNTGVRKDVFKKLKRELIQKGRLKPRRHVGVTEQIGTFLYQLVTNLSVRKMAEWFQRSNETISKSFRAVLNAMVSNGFCSAYMKLPNTQEIPHIIHSNTKFFPFFKDALGAIDGSHLFVKPPAAIKARFRDRKGNLTQNMFAACNFDMFFVYVMTGWEGSAADSLLFQKAMVSGFDIPPGKYYVADAGFPNCRQLLVPYRNVRYHLCEWQAGSKQPQNKEELFNLRHSQLRNVIECIFGIIKRKFRMAAEATEYPIHIQTLIPVAITTLLNFIHHHGEADFLMEVSLQEEAEEADWKRDEIAEAMWASYQEELAANGVPETADIN